MLIFINSGLRVSDYSILKITIGKSHKIFEKFLLICFIATSYDFCYRQASKTGKLPDARCNICQGFLEHPFEPYELLLLHPQDLDVCPLVILPMKMAHTSLYEPFRGGDGGDRTHDLLTASQTLCRRSCLHLRRVLLGLPPLHLLLALAEAVLQLRQIILALKFSAPVPRPVFHLIHLRILNHLGIFTLGRYDTFPRISASRAPRSHTYAPVNLPRLQNLSRLRGYHLPFAVIAPPDLRGRRFVRLHPMQISHFAPSVQPLDHRLSEPLLFHHRLNVLRQILEIFSVRISL